MTNRSILTATDVITFVAGALLVTLSFTGLGAAEAATVAAPISSPATHPVVLMIGATLATFPVTRRMVFAGLFAHHHLSECHDVANAVCRVGLQQRVHAANLYMTDLSDEAIDRAFGGRKELLDWFAPAYADEKLRSQMSPEVLSRIETIARQSGRQIGHA